MFPPKILFHETTHWVARVMAAVLLLITAGILYGHGLPDPAELTRVDITLFLALLVMLLGAALGWRFERLGGALLVGGFLVFYAVNSLAGYRFSVGVVLLLFGLAGALYLLSWASGPHPEQATRTDRRGRPAKAH